MSKAKGLERLDERRNDVAHLQKRPDAFERRRTPESRSAGRRWSHLRGDLPSRQGHIPALAAAAGVPSPWYAVRPGTSRLPALGGGRAISLDGAARREQNPFASSVFGMQPPPESWTRQYPARGPRFPRQSTPSPRPPS